MRTIKLIALAMSLLLFGVAKAETYPSHPIKMIVPFAPGGTADIIARPLAKALGEALDESIIVVNRGGAGGVVGAQTVAQAKNDGYTILLGSNGALTISQHLHPVPYDATKDFAPVGLVATSQFVLVVHPSVPVKNVGELIAYAKAKNGRLTFGSAGIGNVGHLAAELFDSMAGVKMLHVPYAGAGPMTTDLLAGRVSLAFPGLSSMVPLIKSGSLRALAVTSLHRSFLLPDVPTLDEAGLKGYDAKTFWAILAPAGTPKPVIKKLNTALIKALKSDELKKIYRETGNDPDPSTPQELGQRIRQDIQKWGEIVRKAGIKKSK